MSVELFKAQNTLKQGKFLKFLKVTAKPKVLEILKRSWKKSWTLKSSKEYEPWCLIHTVILMIRPKCFLYFQVHLPSLTVFSNWPTSRTPLRYVHTFDFSPNSGYLSIGNDRGKALLFR